MITGISEGSCYWGWFTVFAGSGVLIPLVLSTMSSMAQGLFFRLVFGVGFILGMLLFTGLVSFPFRLVAGISWRLNLWIQAAAGLSV